MTRRDWRGCGAGLVLATALALTAGCSAEPSSASSKDVHVAGRVQFDQALHDLLPAAVKERGTLSVGTDASYAPMSSFGQDGRTIIGVEPDLGAAIGRVLGVRVQFRNQGFMKLLPDVVGGRIDLAMSAMTDTEARARTVDFVNYFSAGTAIVVQRGNPDAITDIKDLCGRLVAVEAGTTQVDLLSRAQRNCPSDRIRVRTYPTNSDALLQLRTGRAAAVLNDLPPAVFLVNDARTRSDYELASTTQYEPGLYGIVVAPDQHGLRDAVQGACEQLLRSGAYAEVLDHWKVGSGAIDRVSIDSDR